MVYNWDGKEAECYRLYVSEKKSLDEVIDYWEQRGFTPRQVRVGIALYMCALHPHTQLSERSVIRD